MERFYSIEHLSTAQLRELFSTYRDGGWVDFDYYKLMPEGVTPPQLPDELILHNINGGNEMNMFVFMLDHEDEQDGIMIGFGLTEYPEFAAYLHLDKSLLDEIVEKYGLEIKTTGEIPFTLNRDNSVN
ncbi:MAG: hypothetical protein PHH93_08635 [Prolixibacteraceae bacterium]|nr:hypothetical protein [Prolixibacteraceae bacterium]